MSDADLLVAPEDVLRARDILIRTGFVSKPMKSSLYRHIILDLGNHLPELHLNGISVDLHHRLFGPEGTTIVRRALDKPEVISADRQNLFCTSAGDSPAWAGQPYLQTRSQRGVSVKTVHRYIPFTKEARGRYPG